jgi:hypothetical protein
MHQNNPLTVWFVGFGIAATLAIMALAIRQSRRRTRDLAALAQRMGFTFLGKDWRGPELSSNYKTSLLQRTRGRFSDAMIGQIGDLKVSVFDYTHGNGKSSETRTLTSFSQSAELPPFELRPENIFDKIGDVLTQNDIDFDSHPEFSRRYHLRTPDETRIRMLFNPSLLTYLEQIPPDQKWHVESSGTSLIIYRHRYPARATEIPTLLNETTAIAKTILTNAGIKFEGKSF